MDSDVEFLGLIEADEGPGHYSFDVTEMLSRPDGQLYGGTAIAVSVATAAMVSERNTIWMTTQFVSSASKGSTVAVRAEVLAGGRRTNQVRVTATDADGHVVFASLGATAADRPNGLAGNFEPRPAVSPPSETGGEQSPFQALRERSSNLDLPPMPRLGFMTASEMQVVKGPDDDDDMYLWVQRRDHAPITPAVAAFFADLVPMGINHRLGVFAAGTSLDNTIRIGAFTNPEWILIHIKPHFASGGYGHGTAHVWDPDGNLLATASQTASMFVLDPDNPPWASAAAARAAAESAEASSSEGSS